MSASHKPWLCPKASPMLSCGCFSIRKHNLKELEPSHQIKADNRQRTRLVGTDRTLSGHESSSPSRKRSIIQNGLLPFLYSLLPVAVPCRSSQAAWYKIWSSSALHSATTTTQSQENAAAYDSYRFCLLMDDRTGLQSLLKTLLCLTNSLQVGNRSLPAFLVENTESSSCRMNRQIIHVA